VKHGYNHIFQGHTLSAKVCQQEISELTTLAQGLLAFERAYLSTHGERTPVFRLLSMINTAIDENITTIEQAFQDGTITERSKDPSLDYSNVPF